MQNAQVRSYPARRSIFEDIKLLFDIIDTDGLHYNSLCSLSFNLTCWFFFSTPLHRAIQNQNEAVFSILLEQLDLDLEVQNKHGETALWLALSIVPQDGSYPPESFAARLLKRGASANACNEETGRRIIIMISIGIITINILTCQAHPALVKRVQ